MTVNGSDDVLLVHGGTPLEGEIRVRGAKNLVPKAMVAALLGSEPSRLRNVPDIRDVRVVRGLLQLHGVTVRPGEEPGELVLVNDSGIRSFRPFEKADPRPCIFEHVYFSRPDSVVDGTSVYEVRKAIGAELSRESPVEADLVVPVPDSGVPAALGFSQESGIPFELGIIRSHYVGRTFIQPSQEVRHLGVKLKHNANSALIQGKRIVLVDDSIVRGTTSLKIVQMMREAGAREVHMRIASPPTRHSCFYGVDTPERAKLLAAQMNVAEMNHYIRADSLAFVSIDGLYRAIGEEQRDDAEPQHCDACFSGDYPTSLTDQEELERKNQLGLVEERAA
jgi:amidophosphoribosyltransferase